MAIASRRGLGKLRHAEACLSWLQEKVRSGEIRVAKVTANENVADALAKHVSREIIRSRMRDTSQVALEGRRWLAPAAER